MKFSHQIISDRKTPESFENLIILKLLEALSIQFPLLFRIHAESTKTNHNISKHTQTDSELLLLKMVSKNQTIKLNCGILPQAHCKNDVSNYKFGGARL